MGSLRRHPPGYEVVFKNPTTKEPYVGTIVDEVWATEPEEFGETALTDNGGWREGAFVAQLIEWPNGHRSVRFTYYLRPEGSGSDSWYFGGQYAASMGVKDYRQLMEKLGHVSW